VRKIVVLSFITLDGVMQAPGGPEEDSTDLFQYGGWSVSYWNEVLEKKWETKWAKHLICYLTGKYMIYLRLIGPNRSGQYYQQSK
jgi:hypothetical protein